MTGRRRRSGNPARGVLAVVLLLAATGCADNGDDNDNGDGGGGGGRGGRDEPALDRSEVEQEVRTRLGESVGREPEQVSCPDDLRAEVGRTIRCTLTDSGTTVGVTVTVRSFADDVATYDIEVDEP